MTQAVYKPKRQGIVKLPNTSTIEIEQRHRKAATKIMQDFCGAKRVEISSIDRISSVTGSTNTNIAGVGYTENSSSDDSYAHFDCIEGAPADPFAEIPVTAKNHMTR